MTFRHPTLARLLAAAAAGAAVLMIAVPLPAGTPASLEQVQARPAPAKPAPAKPGAEETTDSPSAAPERRVDRSRDLDFLFEALKAAPDADSAKLVETRIIALWQASGSDTADLLMSRVRQAVDAKELDLSLQLLDTVVELNPGYVEGWNRRATVHFLKKDFGAAIADLRQTLAREPRHFGALVGLGMILQEIDEEKMALQVLRRALELHPHLPRVAEMIRTLVEKVEGRPI